MEQAQARCWQGFPDLPVTPSAGGELVRGISRDGGDEKIVWLFLLAWKMCVAVRADVFLWHLSCLSGTAPCGLHTHLLSEGWWRGERQPLHRKSAQHCCTSIWRAQFLLSLLSEEPFAQIFFFFFFLPSFLKAEKCLRNALALSPFPDWLSQWCIN